MRRAISPRLATRTLSIWCHRAITLPAAPRRVPSETTWPSSTRIACTRPGFRRRDRNFHLHQFQDQDRSVLLDLVANLGDDFPDIAGDFSLDVDKRHRGATFVPNSAPPYFRALVVAIATTMLATIRRAIVSRAIATCPMSTSKVCSRPANRRPTADCRVRCASWRKTPAQRLFGRCGSISRPARPPPSAITPTRLVMQDLLAVPLLADLASLRDEIAKRGVDPEQINPKLPTDLVIDHSMTVMHFGTAEARRLNEQARDSRSTRNASHFCAGAGILSKFARHSAWQRHRPPNQPRTTGDLCSRRHAPGSASIPNWSLAMTATRR